MNVLKCASAGTMESSDAYIEIEPFENGIRIDVDSIVKKQFGDRIEAVVLDVLKEQGVESCDIKVMDKGALECVIRARVETAVHRAKGEQI